MQGRISVVFSARFKNSDVLARLLGGARGGLRRRRRGLGGGGGGALGEPAEEQAALALAAGEDEVALPDQDGVLASGADRLVAHDAIGVFHVGPRQQGREDHGELGVVVGPAVGTGGEPHVDRVGEVLDRVLEAHDQGAVLGEHGQVAAAARAAEARGAPVGLDELPHADQVLAHLVTGRGAARGDPGRARGRTAGAAGGLLRHGERRDREGQSKAEQGKGGVHAGSPLGREAGRTQG